MRLHLHFAAKPKPIGPGSRYDVEASTRYPGMVQDPGVYGVLKPGGHQRKLGGMVLKGAWKGMPIFSLTLQERRTCPRSCKQWLSCYGNTMGRAVRYRHGKPLTKALAGELLELQHRFPGGFVVRLHILGDFNSVGYVKFWRDALKKYPALHVFGYTARQLSDPIGQLIAGIRDANWERFAVRTSGAREGARTLVIDPGPDAKIDAAFEGAIICPAQTGGTSHCGSCALCWSPAAKGRAIAFLAH